mgnify:CR=1 FL=1
MISSHFLVSPPQKEHTPSGFNPPHEPDKGLLLKIIPIAIPPMAKSNNNIPNKNCILEIKEIIKIFFNLIKI